MLRQHSLLSLVACCFLSGCMTARPTAIVSSILASESTDERDVTCELNVHDPAEREKMLASIDHELIQREMALTPIGSQVTIVIEFDRQYMGTLIKASKDGVELMNCLCKEAVPGPNGQPQCKTSHVPFQSFKTLSMTHFTVLSPPARDFAAPDLHQDTCGLTVAEIVYHDGRRQRWGMPPEKPAP